MLSFFKAFWLQALLAATIGISIGLTVVEYVHHRATASGVRETLGGFEIASLLGGNHGTPPAVDSNGDFNLGDFNLWPKLDHRMNILVMGVDSNGVNTERFLNTRSDTMMFVTLDPIEKKVGVVSIPRDSRVPISGNHGMDKINAAHALGGPQLSVQTVQENFFVPIDHYVVVDAQGLKKAFEVLGPVEVLVEKKMRYRDRAGRLNVQLDPGVQQLDATQLEEYVRFRHDARGDLGRIERQQWFLRQMAQKFKEPAILMKLPGLFKVASDYVVTDLSPKDMAAIAAFGKDIDSSQVETATLPGKAVMINGGSYWEPDLEACKLVFQRFAGINSEFTQSAALLPDASATLDNNETGTQPRPMSVIIRYPRGLEQAAETFETALNNSGYLVRSRQRVDAADCQHQQIMLTSLRADDNVASQLKQSLPDVAKWPVSVNMEEGAPSDLVVIMSPTTSIYMASQALSKEEHSGIGPNQPKDKLRI